MPDWPPSPRNPRQEALDLVGPGFDARVLEPSPPAVTAGPFFADDPVAFDRAEGRPVVGPTGPPSGTAGAGHHSWDRWLADHPDRAGWVAERWLGGPRRLPPVPPRLAASRHDLHRLAAYVIAPARHAATGRFGLRWTLGGFGTPFFTTASPAGGPDAAAGGPDAAAGGPDRQIRVEGSHIVDQRGDEVRSAPITTLAAAAAFLGTGVDTTTAAEHDSPPPGDQNAPLAAEDAASRFLGHWFGMAFAALEAVRADPASVEPSRPQLWPGHFDPSIELGDEDHRGSYGASPGDDANPGPYLYVSLWWPDRIGLADRGRDPFWNATGFTGRLLRLHDFPANEDPVAVAVRFWTSTRDSLHQRDGQG